MTLERKDQTITRRQVIQTAALSGASVIIGEMGTIGASVAAPSPTIADPRFSVPVLDPTRIPKFVDPLPVPGANWPVINAGVETIKLVSASVQILPSATAPSTEVWCYRGNSSYTSTFLGPTMVAESQVGNDVTYDYTGITATKHLLKTGANSVATVFDANSASVVDKHVHGTDLGEPEVRFIAHLHGARGVLPTSDGYAEAWVTPSGTTGTTPADTGPASTLLGTQTHTYPNKQQAALSWYHDHALGITRLNVYAGGAGGYIITDNNERNYIASNQLPDLGIPLVIQDRMFYPNGRLAYPDLPATAANKLIATPGCTAWASPGPSTDISTRPEFFGDVILVNGKSWPYLTVEPKIYRFRFLNGCNARVLDLSFTPGPALPFIIIGTEGGFLPGPSVVQNNLVIGGAERFDVLLDFRAYAGKTLTLVNKGAKKPYPGGTPPNPQSDGLVMQFKVSTGPVGGPLNLPARWSAAPAIADPTPGTTPTRRVLLFEGRDSYGRIQPLLGQVTGPDGGPFNGVPLMWDDPVTETATQGVEVWEVFNTTVDAHPIHIHEVLFKVLNRQTISFKLPAQSCGGHPSFGPITLNTFGASITPAAAYEKGFKDTALCLPGQVTRLVVDFTNSSKGRFVWHCHILEHEDHEMMRPYDVVQPTITP